LLIPSNRRWPVGYWDIAAWVGITYTFCQTLWFRNIYYWKSPNVTSFPYHASLIYLCNQILAYTISEQCRHNIRFGRYVGCWSNIKRQIRYALDKCTHKYIIQCFCIDQPCTEKNLADRWYRVF
jgi:hypothetical protein